MAKKSINPIILNKIQALSQTEGIDSHLLEEFALFVLENQRVKRPKSLSMTELKTAVFEHFDVNGTAALRKAGSFKMATDGMDKLNLRLKQAWEILYRKFVGVLPGEDSEVGDSCINGIDIFKYFQPWRVFGLEAKTASDEEIKQAYRKLSKQYHPDNQESGDSRMFDRINSMYQSISAGA
ncbi:MAG: J domain-containing protein [Phormidesmis sp. RL_2_1]|nr:J domain-containing protein [Phormidesmis sp. RL_2_1]